MQKTSYDVRISDWSSDVCSSDLIAKFLVAKDLATSFADRLNKAAKALDFGDIDVGAIAVQEYIDPYSDLDATIAGSDIAGTVARHPMHHLGGLFARPATFLADRQSLVAGQRV